MKRKLGFVLVLAALFALCIATTAHAACAHTYARTVIRAATCCSSGYSRLKCTKCGALKANSTVTIAATGKHSTRASVTPATCIKAGSVVITCTNSSKVLSTTTQSALGHKYVKSGGKAPTCTTAGYDYLTCSRCSRKTTVSRAALGHKAIWHYHMDCSDVLHPYRCSFEYTDCGRCGYVLDVGWCTKSGDMYHMLECEECQAKDEEYQAMTRRYYAQEN